MRVLVVPTLSRWRTIVGTTPARERAVFVRWKRTRLKRDRYGSKAGEEILRAVVVESRRVGGKPRQRVVRYLGTIRESDISFPRPMSLDRFWQQVDAGLD